MEKYQIKIYSSFKSFCVIVKHVGKKANVKNYSQRLTFHLQKQFLVLFCFFSPNKCSGRNETGTMCHGVFVLYDVISSELFIILFCTRKFIMKAVVFSKI